jgi:hypothetical protein
MVRQVWFGKLSASCLALTRRSGSAAAIRASPRQGRGEKPGDLPVQFPTKSDMVVNIKTAKAFGLMVPQSILLRR